MKYHIRLINMKISNFLYTPTSKKVKVISIITTILIIWGIIDLISMVEILKQTIPITLPLITIVIYECITILLKKIKSEIK